MGIENDQAESAEAENLEAESTVEELQSRLAESEKMREHLRHELEQAREHSHWLREQVDMESTAAALAREATRLVARVASKRKRKILEELGRERTSALRESQRADEAEDIAVSLRGDINSLRDRLRDVEAELEVLRDQLRNAEQLATYQRLQIDELEADADRARADHALYQDLAAEFEAYCAVVRKRASSTHAEASSAVSEVRARRRKVAGRA